MIVMKKCSHCGKTVSGCIVVCLCGSLVFHEVHQMFIDEYARLHHVHAETFGGPYTGNTTIGSTISPST
jgi:hypothetical protein